MLCSPGFLAEGQLLLRLALAPNTSCTITIFHREHCQTSTRLKSADLLCDIQRQRKRQKGRKERKKWKKAKSGKKKKNTAATACCWGAFLVFASLHTHPTTISGPAHSFVFLFFFFFFFFFGCTTNSSRSSRSNRTEQKSLRDVASAAEPSSRGSCAAFGCHGRQQPQACNNNQCRANTRQQAVPQ